jgi:hypothetical protein
MAGMIDGGDDKAGIGERLGHIVMAGEVTVHAMRDDDERSSSRLIGQSFTPDRMIRLRFGSRWISPDGSGQGYHIAPVRAGPSASAGTSMKRKPAACASVAVRQRVIAVRNLAACIGGSPGLRRLNWRSAARGAKSAAGRRVSLSAKYSDHWTAERLPASNTS